MQQKEGKLNIGLSEYQESQWIAALKKYGLSILERSLLSLQQKQALIEATNKEIEILRGFKQQAKLSFYND